MFGDVLGNGPGIELGPEGSQSVVVVCGNSLTGSRSRWDMVARHDPRSRFRLRTWAGCWSRHFITAVDASPALSTPCGVLATMHPARVPFRHRPEVTNLPYGIRYLASGCSPPYIRK